MQTLMDSEEPHRRLRFRLGKRTARALAAIGLMTVVAGGVQTKRYADRSSEENFRHDVAMYLASPGFTGPDFARQIIGTDARLELYDPEKRVLNFISIKKPQDVLPAISSRPDRAEITSDDRYRIGGYSDYEFRFPVSDLVASRDKIIRTGFGNLEYDVSLGELSDFIKNDNVCGGYNTVSTGEYKGFRHVIFTNHQFYTAKRGEPSLARFAEKLIKDVNTNEEKAQKLLDFVTRRIRYDGIDRLNDTQKIKRSSEVLMTKEADCSGKSVLYASLLEQADIDYYIMYFFPEHGDGHMTVAVEGNFPNYNNLAFDINGKRYYIAETTTRGFRIGETLLERSEDFHSGRRYVQEACYKQNTFHRVLQKISSNSDIIDFDSGRPLKMAY